MDYEQRIKQLEQDVRHEQVMRRIMGDRLDAHDLSLGAVRQILTEIAHSQQRTQEQLEQLTELLVRNHSNGKSKD